MTKQRGLSKDTQEAFVLGVPIRGYFARLASRTVHRQRRPTHMLWGFKVYKWLVEVPVNLILREVTAIAAAQQDPS